MAARTLRSLAEVAEQLVNDPPAGTPDTFAGQSAAMVDAIKAQAERVAEWLNGPAVPSADPGGWDAGRHAAYVAALNVRHLLDVAEQVVTDAPGGMPAEAAAMVDRLAALVAAQRIFASQVTEWFDAASQA